MIVHKKEFVHLTSVLLPQTERGMNCVLAEAQCSTGTLDYILQRCQLALQNVHDDVANGDVCLKSFEPAVLKQGEEIHNEVEFEWLRQFWFQGNRYKKCTDWWCQPMAQLEELWKKMEGVLVWHS
ncbi:hypothetical protein P7K49_036358 [Saguinus oedipus]|uniref:Alpha-ketoglutarate-dependent dioxygenase FTO C-terminal domain-containing protein n=1 Tax=Saguinus oedipus TaxID=9490 RepID=A0ABQ9TKV8_SAGOE|nr:hypothetical protein P7K49_036358 [Saguinus oedipus]